MKTKTELEWVTGENPVTGSTKLVSVLHADGMRDTREAYYTGSDWRYASDEESIEVGGAKVEAWASKPIFGIGVPEGIPTPSTILTFGQAVEALKAGKKVTRTGWNGKGLYLWLLPEAKVPADWCKEPHLKALAEGNPDGSQTMHCLPSIRMKTADGKVLTGWLASQTDIFAQDWVVLN